MSLAATIEHTLLKADVTPGAIDLLCDEALEHGFAGVCVNSVFVPRVARRLLDYGGNARPRVVTVVGFPLGAQLASAKREEARQAVELGAEEIDMVIPVGFAVARNFDVVSEHVAEVREGIGEVTLKVILETGYFDRDALEQVVAATLKAGPDFLKTSTGFGPTGADPDEVAWLKERCPQGVRVKASGGIRARPQAEALVAAGADRLGASRSLAVIGK